MSVRIANREDILYSLDSVKVNLEYWILTESRISLKLVLGGVRIVALSSSSHE